LGQLLHSSVNNNDKDVLAKRKSAKEVAFRSHVIDLQRTKNDY